MISLSQIHIRIQRLPSGNFACYGETEQANAVPDYTLRKLLFAWHERSYYGTQIETMTSAQGSGLVMTPYMAMDYLAAPGTLLHGKLSWDEDARLLMQGAVLFKEALQYGWYMPSYERWCEGKIGWKLKLPSDKQAEFTQLSQGKRLDAAFWQDWLDAIVEEMLHLDGEWEISSAWKSLKEENALLCMDDEESAAVRTSLNWMQEDDWLTAIGWKQDAAPYRICVQLVEPYAETYVDGTTTAKDDAADWRLRFIAQDRKDTNRFVEFSAAGNCLTGQIPAAWQENIDERIQEQTTRILRIVPALQSTFQLGKIVEQLSDDEAWEFLTESSLQLVAAGISVFLPSWWEGMGRLRPLLKAKLQNSVGSSRKSMFGMDQIIQFDWRVALGTVDLSEEEFLQMAAQKKRLMYTRGKWVQLDPAYLEQIRAAMRQVEKKKGLTFREVLEMHLLEGNEANTNESGDEQRETLQVRVELNNHLRTFMKQLNQIKSIPLVEEIDGLEADLRHYQIEGVSWLLFLRQMGLGGCLADDMGLGKTIQFIAYLLQVKKEKSGTLSSGKRNKRLGPSEVKESSASGVKTLASAPSLLICPTSVLGNWQKELERFAPSLNIHLHYGGQRAKGEEFETSIQGADLVMTSYSLANLDEEELSSISWNALCLDEAQNIKNAYTKQASAIRSLEARQRIALTGTPIENRLTELWSIFDFINPGYLGTLSHFSHQYVSPIEKNGGGAAELTSRVQRLIRPFLLRRLKKDPAIQLDLPDKYEVKAYVSLTSEQGALYENVVQSLLEKVDSLNGIEKKGLILASLTKLKQICDHPALFLKEAGTGASSGARASTNESVSASARKRDGAVADSERQVRSKKMERLLEMIDELRAEGGNCLIFTQFVEMGHLLQVVISQERSEPVQFLHGGLSKAKRDEMIARFQDSALPDGERCSIFILSLKAGGTGLNLTAANHVFHYDRWWNPAVENQATDRAYRIGQTRDVQVHKFVTLGTLEERIDEMIERKKGLSDQIVGTGENWITEMSTGELRELFALRREWMEK
ncbi:DEAD/DEAH box helicase [Paenibacillus sp. N3.4]|uniref:DEAD/DEAH box helicase n=1 Tax=Paenibacillus sp. N3.4 TaxID=2603222 RepID=UPI0011C87D26|nr:DEAD/DEAH box helicase [Paenibacillus sp. N3.4]TXK76922.1 DEAD/DEAH box helicase [Paenibacillus sp. N3.4]